MADDERTDPEADPPPVDPTKTILCKSGSYHRADKVGWCCDCGTIDAWKFMIPLWVDSLTPDQRQRLQELQATCPDLPGLRYGKYNEIRLYRCTDCTAAQQGITHHEALRCAIRDNSGPGSVKHTVDRIGEYKKTYMTVKVSIDVLVGYARTKDGRLALRDATEGTGRGINPASTGAGPANAWVARQVGRPIGVESAPVAPLRPAGPLPENGPDDGWTDATGAAVEEDELERRNEVYQSDEEADADSSTLARLGYSRRELHILARCHMQIEMDTIRVCMTGMMSCIIAKKRT